MLFTVLSDIARAGLRLATGKSAISRCPVCAAEARILGEVDFNKSCEDRNGVLLPKANTTVRYFLCNRCGFCFAPEFKGWSDRKFIERIYNDEYVLVDPEYVALRPQRAASYLENRFGPVRDRIAHLDYGGGNGLLSRLLCAAGWRSASHDDFVEGPGRFAQLSTYDLVTAFEVFEHVADPQRLMSALSRVTHPRSLILFSTLLSDGTIAPGRGLDWWYLAPRNGHISLYSSNSLSVLLSAHGYRLLHFDEGFHVAFREFPEWAAGLSLFRGVGSIASSSA